jgi:hypothetical protein
VEERPERSLEMVSNRFSSPSDIMNRLDAFQPPIPDGISAHAAELGLQLQLDVECGLSLARQHRMVDNDVSRMWSGGIDLPQRVAASENVDVGRITVEWSFKWNWPVGCVRLVVIGFELLFWLFRGSR